ncbi:hypothetical protein LZ009_05110 [Ramlibacter sp. XY19]|uniref:hypothetical protein n=1 Tax=Ramlibacter paludis TaxID=2908000 RepID=UPI0023DAC0B0|nr:hypothetical protein [Ramlibacter paludis]MCG2592155.1 hypothetical protein [Ramlibacter paludis]
MKHKLRAHVAAIMLLAPAAATFVALPAAAQAAAPVITSMAVNADEGLSPGSTLNFQLYAAPKARKADVVLGKSGIVVPLRERTPGNYTGTYTVRRSDRIDPTQLMAARVTHKQTIARNFAYPPSFQALALGAGPAPVAAAPTIERFVMRPMGRIEPGRELHFRLMGAPGADAWLDIPGVIAGVDLAETRPGVYEGNYTVRRRDNLDAFRNAVATLRSGNTRSTAKLDMNWNGWERDQRQARDERPPQITELMPANGERVTERGRASIGAKLSDEGAGIDPASVRLKVAGRDVTADARVTEDEVRYRADLEPGRYTAELSVRDKAGNTSSKAWTFDVANDRGDRGDRYGGGPLPLRITSHANGATIDGAGALRLEGRTAPGANVRVQVESVANVGGLLGVTQPVMDQTIQADRDGHFSVAVQPSGLPIPGQRYDVRMTANDGRTTAEERITLQRRG